MAYYRKVSRAAAAKAAPAGGPAPA
jgi:hypothetical protein